MPRVKSPHASTRLQSAGLLAAGIAIVMLVPPAPAPLLAGLPQAERRPAGWEESTHGQRAADYGRVFAVDRVHELRIVIPPASFAAMQDDLRTITPLGGGMRGFGPGGPPGRGGLAGRGGLPPFLEPFAAACSEKEAGAACSAEGVTGRCNAFPPVGFGAAGPASRVCMATEPAAFGPGRGLPGGGGALKMIARDPMYVPVSVEYDGRVWTRVGMRYKGNSSLAMGSMSGNGKIPFRLDFDRYEDEYPETRNQRFHGFQKLTFSSNFGDDSQLREALASEIFRERGVPAARAAFYRVVVDTGAGPEYWGLYTIIEDPADGAMLTAQFGSASGNLYKPDGPGADWTRFDPEGFPKKTNEKEADFADVQAALAALHAPQTDAAAWRARLEATFDVPLFLRWLAVNTTIQNWDAYGAMAHNYYLYGDPAQKGRLRWIPWDNNFSLGAGPFGGGAGGPVAVVAPFPPGGGPPGAPPGAGRGGGPPFAMFGGGNDVLHRQAGERWPLIARVLADETYAARYRSELARALEGSFALDTAAARIRTLHRMIAPAVVGERGERGSHTTVSSPDAFERAVDGPTGLLATIRSRHEAVRAALATTPRP